MEALKRSVKDKTPSVCEVPLNHMVLDSCMTGPPERWKGNGGKGGGGDPHIIFDKSLKICVSGGNYQVIPSSCGSGMCNIGYAKNPIKSSLNKLNVSANLELILVEMLLQVQNSPFTLEWVKSRDPDFQETSRVARTRALRKVIF